MKEFPMPPYALWEKVGYKNEVWTVCGFFYRQGYQVYGWDYLLVQPTPVSGGGVYLSCRSPTVKTRDDELMTLSALLDDRVKVAGKYAAETQRIAKEAQAEFERLAAQIKGGAES